VVDEVESPDTIAMEVDMGFSVPAHCSVGGEAILAQLSLGELRVLLQEHGPPQCAEKAIVSEVKLLQELEMVRRNGYATTAGEHFAGGRGISAPIVGPCGKARAAVSATGVGTHPAWKRYEDVVQAVKAAARVASKPFPRIEQRGDDSLSFSSDKIKLLAENGEMATTTRMSFEEFLKLPEREGGLPIYELDEGELLIEASPTHSHNRIRERIALHLRQFAKAHRSGDVVQELDFRLGWDTVGNPDVAFIAEEHLATVDRDRSPIEGAPVLAVEVVSPSNSAYDMSKKVEQYLAAGSQAVWLVHPALRLVEVHTASGSCKVRPPDHIEARTLIPDSVFSLPLAEVFDADPHSY
jgi:Uma2 family endonuclease